MARPRGEPIDRFLIKIQKQDTCWLWIGTVRKDGYGYFKNNGSVLAHRFSYSYFKGTIPENKQIDHLCRVRNCVNPNHLEAVTARENILRGFGYFAKNARKTNCPKGHDYTAVKKPNKPLERECLVCKKEKASLRGKAWTIEKNRDKRGD